MLDRGDDSGSRTPAARVTPSGERTGALTRAARPAADTSLTAAGRPASSARASGVPRRGAFELRCSDVHPCRCDEVFRGDSPVELVERARRHGELVHGFTPAFYAPRRMSTMTIAAAGLRE